MWSLTKGTGLEFEDPPGLVVSARTGGGGPDQGFLHLIGVPIVGLFGLGGHDNSDSCPDHLIVRPLQPLNIGLPF